MEENEKAEFVYLIETDCGHHVYKKIFHERDKEKLSQYILDEYLFVTQDHCKDLRNIVDAVQLYKYNLSTQDGIKIRLSDYISFVLKERKVTHVMITGDIP